MPTVNDMEAELYAREHLLSSGIAAQLKANKIYVWTIRADKGRLYIAIDNSANPDADLPTIQRIIVEFLAPLQREIQVHYVPIQDNCCYGVCHGCFNGDPALKRQWLD